MNGQDALTLISSTSPLAGVIAVMAGISTKTATNALNRNCMLTLVL